jgi:hypothetical protein
VPARSAADIPVYPTWADWTYVYIPAGQLLVLRGLHPASPWPYAPTGLSAATATPPRDADVPRTSEIIISVSWNVAGDRVTTPTRYGGNGTNFQNNLPFPLIQLRASVPTWTAGIISDSTGTGTVPSGGQTSYAPLQYACDLLGVVGGGRIVPYCGGWSGKQASQYIAYGDALLASPYCPDILIYQLWSQNNTSATSYETEIALAAGFVSDAVRAGKTIVLMTGIPNNAWGAGDVAKDNARKAANALIKTWGVPVIDADAVLSDGGSPAKYKAEYGTGAHPPYEAYQALAVEYARA